MHKKTVPHFAVTVEAHLPQFDSERLFVVNEKAFAQQEVAKLRERSKLLNVLAPVLGEPKLKDWRDYAHALDQYVDKLNKHEQEIADGLMPVKFFVINLTDGDDKAIKIQVKIAGGTVHPAQKPPQRPTRIDGPQHVVDWTPSSAPSVATVVSGFSRSQVKIGAHAIAAEFSELEAQDSADLVHEVLYIQGDEQTRFTYEITSKHVKTPEHGDVVLAG